MFKNGLSTTWTFAGGGVYSNVIFMGQPLVTAMFGAEGLIFCVAVMFASNVYLFTACSVLFSYKCGIQTTSKKW